MRKLHLDIDNLTVESFETVAEDAQARGTVVGHGPKPPTADRFCTIGPISDDEPTCQISCGYIDTCRQLGCGIEPI